MSCSYERVIHVSVVTIGHQHSKKDIPNSGPTNGLVLENVLIIQSILNMWNKCKLKNKNLKFKI